MNARDLSLITLDRFDLPEWPAASLAALRIEPRGHRPGVTDPRDHELAARITSEVTRNLLLINHLIAHFADRSIRKIDPVVRKILGVALVQILFLDRVPVSAAVDQAVEQTRRFRKKSAAGFVNAVLRRAVRGPMPELPDADDDPLGYAHLALSHPRDLVDRLVALLDTANALKFCRHDQRRPPTILRLSPGVSIEQLQAEGVTLTPWEGQTPAEPLRANRLGGSLALAMHEGTGMVVMQPTINALLSEWSARGLAQAQDPTAASVVALCDLHPGQAVLDRCCGLGTKTLQLREGVGETGVVVAIDRQAARVETLRSIVQSRGIENLHIALGSSVNDSDAWIPEKGFDRVLVDAPCSNSGVLARRTTAKYFQDNATLESLRKLQQEILTDTALAVATGGLLIYSTCSIWPEENERMAEHFMRSNPEFTLIDQRTTLPSFDVQDATRYHDGGYVAVLKRTT